MAKFLSIEIDNCNIKIIEAIKKGEALSISRCMTVNINCGINDGRIIDMLVVNKISEALKSNNIKTRKAVFVINSSSSIVRKIKLPLLKKNSEILSMIQIELQQLLSADLDMYNIVYEISNITVENDTSYAEYIVYCVPVVLVNQYMDLAEKLNLKLIKIDIPARCINSIYKNNIKVNDININKETTAFINVKENFISFSVANNGFCDFYISSEIENTYIKKAAEFRPQYMNTDSFSNVDNTIISLIVKLMRYYYSVSKNKSINKIYIYGSNLEEMNEIKTKLNIDAEIISSISNLSAEEINTFELSEYFNVVLTLFSHSNITFNTTRNKKIRNNYSYAVISAIIMIVCIVLFGFINSQYSMSNRILAMTSFIDDGNNNEINNKIENIKSETDYLAHYLKSVECLQHIINENDDVDSIILRKINMSKPSETKVTSIRMDKNSTQLQCVSLSMSETTLFFSKLREIEQIDSVYIPEIQSKTEQGFSYSVVLKLKDVISNDN